MGMAMLRLAAVLCGLSAGIAAMSPPAQAAGAYCPSPAHGRPAKVPADLIAAFTRTFGIDAAAAHDAAYVRCAGGKLLGCYVGANLDCDKANTRRVLTGATAWCRSNPGAANIPMVATGHDTIYDWSCRRRRAVAGKALVTVDPQGYIADNWKDIR
jgi:hypothetical protein